jgi:ABC-type transporter Mla subunit MlaD
MPLQDLTPQLRTRLNKMERAVGWFVFIAAALLLFGFGYYIYHTAERKGWFKIKAPFHIYVQSSTGLNVGDPVVMMGFAIGNITKVDPQEPYSKYNVKVEFEVVDPYFRRIWRDGSYVKVNAADFLGKRQLEVTRGTNGPAICVTQPGTWKTIPELQQLITPENDRWQLYQDVLDAQSNLVYGAYTMLTISNVQRIAELPLNTNGVFVYDNKVNHNRIVASWDNRPRRYVNFEAKTDTAWLRASETAPIGDQLQAMVSQVQAALPNILSITNKLFAVLDNAANATSNLNTTIVAAQPMVTNFALISGQLREPGGLTTWALGTNGDFQVQTALTNANTLLFSVDTNLNQLTAQIGLTLENVANITSNLNAQVQANSNMLGGISKTVMDADDLMQGLKRHWLLRSAFKVKATNAPPTKAK